MKKAVACVMTAAMLSATVPVFADADKPTLYIAGDSTAQTYDYAKVYPQTGWGQVFAD